MVRKGFLHPLSGDSGMAEHSGLGQGPVLFSLPKKT